MSTQSQIQRGRDAMIAFNNASVGYPAYQFKSIDAMLEAVSPGSVSIFLEGLGMSIELNEMSASKVKSAMQAFAAQAQGRLPANKNNFFKALSDEVMNYSFVDAAKFTAVESAKDIGQGVAEVGDTLITTLKSLKAIFPILVVGAVIFYVVQKTKKFSA